MYFSDQKIADQHATRRMHRWYMVAFRQFIEWSILNTGVILRNRPNGKKTWTGLNLNITLAKDLFRLSELSESVEAVAPQPVPVELEDLVENSDNSDELENQFEPLKVRFDKSICHVPVERAIRRNCAAHRQRKNTRFYCVTCRKFLCLGMCWKLYHTKRNYLFDDPDSTAVVVHETPVD